jgi:hypothetical protein
VPKCWRQWINMARFGKQLDDRAAEFGSAMLTPSLEG